MGQASAESVELAMGYVEAFPIGTWDYCDGCGKGQPKTQLFKETIDQITLRWLCKECLK